MLIHCFLLFFGTHYENAPTLSGLTYPPDMIQTENIYIFFSLWKIPLLLTFEKIYAINLKEGLIAILISVSHNRDFCFSAYSGLHLRLQHGKEQTSVLGSFSNCFNYKCKSRYILRDVLFWVLLSVLIRLYLMILTDLFHAILLCFFKHHTAHGAVRPKLWPSST